MVRVFKETPTFTKKIESIGDDSLLKDIQDTILQNPHVGATVAGTGGLRKFRVGDPLRGKGKRGGLRVIFLDLADKEITYLVLIYGKDEADDLSAEQKKSLKKIVEAIRGESR